MSPPLCGKRKREQRKSTSTPGEKNKGQSGILLTSGIEVASC